MSRGTEFLDFIIEKLNKTQEEQEQILFKYVKGVKIEYVKLTQR